MTYKNIMFGAVFSLVIGMAAWLTLKHDVATKDGNEDNTLPDAYMEDVEAVIMNKQGKMSLKIETPKITHYKNYDVAMFTTPHLTIYRKTPQPWFVTSLHAKTTNGLDKINFWDDVIIHHSADESSPATVIKTTSLVVHPSDQIAETDKPITLVQPNIVVNGTGMLANMNTGFVKLLKQARGEYVPG